MLAVGGIVGVLGGLVAMAVIPARDGADVVALMRAALVFPAAVFVAWWLTSPGLARHRRAVQLPGGAARTDAANGDRGAGADALGAPTIDATGVPAVGHRPGRDAASPELERLRSSLRSLPRRPEGPTEAAYAARTPGHAPISAPVPPGGATAVRRDDVDEAFARHA